MQEFGHPIVGDRRYGSQEDPADRVCLHATELAFAHPGTGETLRFVSPAPAAFLRLVGRKGTEGTTHESADWTGKGIAGRQAPTRETIEVMTAQSAAPAPILAPPTPSTRTAPSTDAPTSSWDHVADWYNTLIEERGSDHHEKIIIPGTVRLLEPVNGQKVLDVACGQGNLCRALATLGAECTGVDASAKLVEAAKRIRVHGARGADTQPRFVTGDARALGSLGLGKFDAASCVMALMNIEPLTPVLLGVASLLMPRGRFVSVILHPAFRAPGQTSWGWDSGAGAGARRDGPPPTLPKSRTGKPVRSQKRSTPAAAAMTQFRRVDGYLSSARRSVIMNPGAAASGKDAVTTWTYHRAIQTYVKLFAEAGFAIDAMEEWPSLRTSQPGPTAAEENRARREIPMFMAIRAIRM
jgi:SAM-dependent methyltransferase